MQAVAMEACKIKSLTYSAWNGTLPKPIMDTCLGVRPLIFEGCISVQSAAQI